MSLMLTILLMLLIVIFLIQFFISMYFVLRILILYKDLSSFQLLSVVILGNIAIVTSLIYYNADMINEKVATMSFVFALLAIIMIIVLVATFLDKSIYSVTTRALSKISIFVFSIVIGFILSEFIIGGDHFFYLKIVSGQYIPHYGLTPSLLILFGGILILSALYLSYKDIKNISESLLSKKSFYLIMISSSMIFVAFLINLVLQTVSVQSLVQTQLFNKDSIYLTHFTFLNLLSFSFAYFSYTQPFLNLSGARPDLLIKKGLLGYYLAYHSDNGPEPLTFSQEFVQNSNITEEILLGLAVSSIILVGTFQEEESHFLSKVSLIPIPGMERYSAVVYSFLSKSKGINDERFRNRTPTVFAILFPSNLTIAIRNMHQTLKDVLEYCQKYPSIEELNQFQVLLSLTTIILRKIL